MPVNRRLPKVLANGRRGRRRGLRAPPGPPGLILRNIFPPKAALSGVQSGESLGAARKSDDARRVPERRRDARAAARQVVARDGGAAGGALRGLPDLRRAEAAPDRGPLAHRPGAVLV